MRHGYVQAFPSNPMHPQTGTIVTEGGETFTFSRSGGPKGGRTDIKVGDPVSFCSWVDPTKVAVATQWWYRPAGTPASWKAPAFTHNDGAQYVRSNLQQFGLTDQQVIGKRWVQNDRGDERFVLETQPMELSELCGNSPEVQYAPGYKTADYMTRVFDPKGAIIGVIDSDRRFLYNSAPDIRSCIGWAVATDLGRTQHLNFNLDEAARVVTEAMGWCPELRGGDRELKEFYFGTYRDTVKEIIKRDVSTRFDDGGAAHTPLWRVATLKLKGEEHPGFPYYS